jgi:hypothetical protein
MAKRPPRRVNLPVRASYGASRARRQAPPGAGRARDTRAVGPHLADPIRLVTQVPHHSGRSLRGGLWLIGEFRDRVSVPKQGGYQACRVPVMWFTALSARPEAVQLPAMPVLAARAGDLSAVSGVRAPGTADKCGRQACPGRRSAGTGCRTGTEIVTKPASARDTPQTQVDLGCSPGPQNLPRNQYPPRFFEFLLPAADTRHLDHAAVAADENVHSLRDRW